jgi:hypothetical protein
MTPARSFLDVLKLAAEHASAAENKFRSEIAERTQTLETERAFAFRKFNMIRAIADVVASAESDEIAVAGATAVLRTKLGWSSDSEARDAVLVRFVPVARAMFATLAPPEDEDAPAPDVIEALVEFERWYVETHPNPFWKLFETYMPETPVVDF